MASRPKRNTSAPKRFSPPPVKLVTRRSDSLQFESPTKSMILSQTSGLNENEDQLLIKSAIKKTTPQKKTPVKERQSTTPTKNTRLQAKVDQSKNNKFETTVTNDEEMKIESTSTTNDVKEEVQEPEASEKTTGKLKATEYQIPEVIMKLAATMNKFQHIEQEKNVEETQKTISKSRLEAEGATKKNAVKIKELSTVVPKKLSTDDPLNSNEAKVEKGPKSVKRFRVDDENVANKEVKVREMSKVVAKKSRMEDVVKNNIPAKEHTPKLVQNKKLRADDVSKNNESSEIKTKKPKLASSFVSSTASKQTLKSSTNEKQSLEQQMDQPTKQPLKPLTSQPLKHPPKSTTPQSTKQFPKPVLSQSVKQTVKPSLPPKKPTQPSTSSSLSTVQLNLLDDIMGSQDLLWKDRNKTEEQRADERRRLEFERRRKSAENPFEKGAVVAKALNFLPTMPQSSFDTREHSYKHSTHKKQLSPEVKPSSAPTSSTVQTPHPVQTPSSAQTAVTVPALPSVQASLSVQKTSPVQPLSPLQETLPVQTLSSIASAPSSSTFTGTSSAEHSIKDAYQLSPVTAPSTSIASENQQKLDDILESMDVATASSAEEDDGDMINQNFQSVSIKSPISDSIEKEKTPEPSTEEIARIVIQKTPVFDVPATNNVDEILPELEKALEFDENVDNLRAIEALELIRNAENQQKKEATQAVECDENVENVRVEESLDVVTKVKGLNDASSLIATANVILETIQQSKAGNSSPKTSITYEQVEMPETEKSESLKVASEDKVEMEFYGEPVPDDDENDDLFDVAAGISKTKRVVEPKKPEEEALPDNETIELDYYNADINIKSDVKNKWLVDPENADGFALMWGCVRSNYGLRMPNNVNERGALPPYICYQVRIKEYLPLKHLPFEELDPYELRLGWSAESVQTIVGESAHSYAYCTTGRKATNNRFTDYGQTVSIDDFVTVVLDTINNEMRVYVNNLYLGATFTNLQFYDPLAPTSSGDYTVIFPHVGIKNTRVFVNFGVELPDPDFVQWPMPSFLAGKQYKFFGELYRFPNLLTSTPRPPASKKNCTMVGLPAAGKTRWVENYLHEHSDEKWIVINAEKMLEFMRVNGVTRKRVHQGRWDAVMGLAAKASNRAFQLICRRRHNYIIDHTNVSREKRKQKLAFFQDFICKCVVIVPTAEDFEHRQMRQARENPTEQIPPEALLQLKGMFTLPETEHEPFDEILFVEPPPERIGEAIESVRRFNEEGRPYLPVFNQRRR